MDLPKVNDILSLESEGFRLCVISVDLEENIWTCVEEITGEIKLFQFDENCNSAHVAPILEIALMKQNKVSDTVSPKTGRPMKDSVRFCSVTTLRTNGLYFLS